MNGPVRTREVSEARAAGDPCDGSLACAGRFTTRDSVLTEHPYVYCAADPVNAVDPDGEGETNWQEVWHVGVLGLGAFVGGLLGAAVGSAIGGAAGSPAGPPGAASGAVVGGNYGAGIGAVLGGMLAEIVWQHRQEVLEFIREVYRVRPWQYPTYFPIVLPLKYW